MLYLLTLTCAFKIGVYFHSLYGIYFKNQLLIESLQMLHSNTFNDFHLYYLNSWAIDIYSEIPIY